jgi:hypothetical protein
MMGLIDLGKNKKRLGDRKDGKLLRDLDSMHYIVPLLYPNRCDNEAFISERVDLTAINAYLEKKNADGGEFPLKLFYVIVAAMARTVALRPKMNRFIANKNVYQRNELTASFVVKKQFADNANEALAIIHFSDDDTIDTVKDKIVAQITSCRSDKADSSTESMDMFNRMPRFLSRFIVWIVCRLDVHGLVPASLIESDPYYSSIVLTNLGSIKLHSGYHHLTNWGTNSLFVAVGERKLRPFFSDDGTFEMRDSLDLGLTVDERIADGYYYSKSVRLLKKLLENPELLERPLTEEVDY